MNWKLKLFLLLLGAIPAFTGYPVNRFDAEVVTGIPRAWTVYFLIANAAFWTVVGITCFRAMEDWSRSKGTLGAY